MKAQENSVVLVEDDPDLRDAIFQGLQLAGFSTSAFSNGSEALSSVLSELPGVLVSDIRMPGLDGRQLLKRVMAADSELPVILMTGHGDIDQAVDALRGGAYDFLPKPFALDRLLESIARALEKRRLVLENRRLRALVEVIDQEPHISLVGQSLAIRRLVAMIGPIGATDADVIVQGEAGTFKAEIARLLHAASGRRKRAFVSIDCDTLPDHMLEVRLFGENSSKGKQPGLVASARGGTLHLGAVEAASLAVQVRLLRLLEANNARQGSDTAADVRVIATTSIDLGQAIAAGSFRSDLYFRLAPVQLEVPPLRARRGDIPALFARFLGVAARRYQRAAPPMSDAVLERLSAYDWPGNARELQHFAEQQVLGLNTPGPDSKSGQSLQSRVSEFEADVIRGVLQSEKGDIRATCDRLGIPRKTLYDKLARYGILPGDFRQRR